MYRTPISMGIIPHTLVLQPKPYSPLYQLSRPHPEQLTPNYSQTPELLIGPDTGRLQHVKGPAYWLPKADTRTWLQGQAPSGWEVLIVFCQPICRYPPPPLLFFFFLFDIRGGGGVIAYAVSQTNYWGICDRAVKLYECCETGLAHYTSSHAKEEIQPSMS